MGHCHSWTADTFGLRIQSAVDGMAYHCGMGSPWAHMRATIRSWYPQNGQRPVYGRAMRQPGHRFTANHLASRWPSHPRECKGSLRRRSSRFTCEHCLLPREYSVTGDRTTALMLTGVMDGHYWLDACWALFGIGWGSSLSTHGIQIPPQDRSAHNRAWCDRHCT